MPPRGGLAVATAGGAVAAAILPTNPNAMLRMPDGAPGRHSPTSHSPREVLRLADGTPTVARCRSPGRRFRHLPSKQFVGEAIARAIATLVGGGHWAAIERKLVAPRVACRPSRSDAETPWAISTEHKTLGSTIALQPLQVAQARRTASRIPRGHHAAPGELRDLRNPGRRRCRVPPHACRLRPAYITEWEAERGRLASSDGSSVAVSLPRGAFAVLGTRTLNDAAAHGARASDETHQAVGPRRRHPGRLETLGLDPDAVGLSLPSRVFLAIAAPGAASFMCPTSPGRLVDAVIGALRPLDRGMHLPR